jgi:2-haloacid dehalogenase
MEEGRAPAAGAAADDPAWLASRPVLIFDLGGVILDWNPRHLFTKLIPDDEAREWFLSEICGPEWNAQMDAGRPFSEAVEELAGHHPGHAEWIRAYWTRWPEMLGGPVPGTSELVAELSEAGRKLYAISNFSDEMFPVALESYPVLRCFRDIVISSSVRLCKPDPRIFTFALGRFGVTAGDCLFIDDLAQNVAGARAAGIAAVQFTSAAELRRLLAAGEPAG